MFTQARVIIALVSLALLIASGFGLLTYGYAKGSKSGKAEVQSLWDESNKQAAKESAKLRTEGYTLAQEYLTRLNKLEARYVRTDSNLRRALAQPNVCPAGGTIGDVLLPSALVDSMFNRDESGSIAPGATTP